MIQRIANNSTNEVDRALNGRARVNSCEFFSAHEFRKLCEYERLRADRSKSAFSLISLSFPKQHTLVQRDSTLTYIIGNRIRQIDEFGNLSDDQLGILMPCTSLRGAKDLAADLISLLPASIPQPSIEIFEYRPRFHVDRDDNSPSTMDQNLADVSSSDIAEILVQPMPFWKRAVDTIGAIGSLILLAPLLLLIAIAIKISSTGPVVFAQRRTGRGGKPFWMYKFRSMIDDAEKQRKNLLHLNEQDGPAFKIQRDPRTTWIGHWLRSLSLDELPQLWNVLKGDMSFVGPRPLPCEEADKCEPWQRRRLAVTPGITCIWQVQDRSTPVPFAEWMRMDIRYANSVSRKQDFRLLLETICFLFGRRNR